MTPQQVVEVFPDLEGLYIPHAGEIIEWGTGHAFVTQSPLDSSDSSYAALMAISLNGGIWGPFVVHRHLAMGPIRPLSLEQQEQVLEYINNCYGKRFTKMFEKYPHTLLQWNAYREEARKQAS